MQEEIIGNCRLILGDCREILPNIDKHDAYISDPPYGIGFKYDGDYVDKGGEDYMSLISIFKGLPSVLLQYPEETMRYYVPVLGVPDDCVAWCYNSNTKRQFRLWSFFGIKPDFNQYKIPAKNPKDKRVSPMVRSYDWFSDIQQVKNVSAEKTEHPCQQPVESMRRIIAISGAKTIADPFMGSGTTGVACASLGLQFTGIDREQKYFDIACKRIEDAYKQQTGNHHD